MCGLEIDLGMMADIGRAKYVTEYDGGIVVKGFSSMFVLTAQTAHSVNWHFIYEEDGCRIPYHSASKYDRFSKGPPKKNHDVSVLGFSRNFIGWASSAILRTGNSSIPTKLRVVIAY